MPTLAATTSTLYLAKLIPTLPFLSMILCGLLGATRSTTLKNLAGWVTAVAVGGSFIISFIVLRAYPEAGHTGGVVIHYFDWINIGGFTGDFSFFIDPLTLVMLMVVTGIGTLITIYAAGYMSGDPGYFRFFAYISLFIFAMTCLVLADNLLLLYLGWEGVGAASYLLIGFYYRKPSAVAAAKKAFIVNRIGDFGFALGLMGTFVLFGSIQYTKILPAAEHLNLASLEPWQQTLAWWIPFLLMLGAFGKSAQLPLHVWLPDAMEGPTPVSALIHAATMVTAGVYMIARLIHIFELSPQCLALVATVGAVTAFFAATIALCQYDLKRVWAYSTLSQLGYMFLGVGVMGTTGAVFHLFTHAFFKALLFLTAGSVMHAMAGQLDLRKMSGLFSKMPVTAILMLIGCLALAGVPLTAGFYSKDMILADALIARPVLGWIGIITALMTAFYTFRLWFRVFLGETKYEMGHEHHGYPVEHHHDDHDHGHHEPHEMPWWPMNLPLVILALGALFAGMFGIDWMQNMIHSSTAAVAAHHDEAAIARHEAAHSMISIVTGGGAIVMIALAYFFHAMRRDLTDKIAASAKPIVTLLYNKYYIDEAYNFVIRGGLNVIAWICYLFDKVIIDGLIIDVLFGRTPRAAAFIGRSLQRGPLQGYALTMGFGVAIVLFFVVWKVMAG
ncbi:MAG: NADH-quinone oxidoreductase subunit L [Planctomycetes bacterium]|nr:NADH-quinone oxidoreductase subunit L [Planctomycetota bacterium]